MKAMLLGKEERVPLEKSNERNESNESNGCNKGVVDSLILYVYPPFTRF